MQQQALALLGLLGLRVALPPQLVDVRLAGWLLDPERSMESADGPIPRLKVLQALLAGSPGGAAAAYNAACAGLAPLSPMQQQPGAGCVEACRAAAASRATWRLQLPQLQRLPGLLSALLEQEMPLAAILAEMESRGIGICAAALERSKCLAPTMQLPWLLLGYACSLLQPAA
jgi:DNA polymerase I-like protein with 3'-5' exonuclease and polymerase domains